MARPSIASSLSQAASGILRLAGRPVRRAQGDGDVVLEVYRGYGTGSEVFLIGRVFRQTRPNTTANSCLRSELHDIGRRLGRRSVANANVTARFYGAEESVATDPDGYFRLHLYPKTQPSADVIWHLVELTLTEPQHVEAQGQVYIPPPHSRFVVISDIDDTVMRDVLTSVPETRRISPAPSEAC